VSTVNTANKLPVISKNSVSIVYESPFSIAAINRMMIMIMMDAHITPPY